MSIDAVHAFVGDKVGWNWFEWGGCALALTLGNLGAAYGTAKSGMAIAGMAVTRPHLAFKGIVPVIMAGILSIYGLIISVLISQNVRVDPEINGPGHAAKSFSAGLVCGLSQIAAGYAIGVVGEVGVRKFAQNEAIYIALILILIFAEVLGLYGMIVAIILQLGG